MTTSQIIIAQTKDKSVIDFCKKVDNNINADCINKQLQNCLTWGNKLAVDFDANFSCVKKEFEDYV